MAKGAFTYDVRCFGGTFDLPTLIRYFTYYISLCNKIDVTWPTYLLKNLTLYLNAPKGKKILFVSNENKDWEKKPNLLLYESFSLSLFKE